MPDARTDRMTMVEPDEDAAANGEVRGASTVASEDTHDNRGAGLGVEHDVVVHMAPKSRTEITVRITSARKGTPRFVSG